MGGGYGAVPIDGALESLAMRTSGLGAMLRAGRPGEAPSNLVMG